MKISLPKGVMILMSVISFWACSEKGPPPLSHYDLPKSHRDAISYPELDMSQAETATDITPDGPGDSGHEDSGFSDSQPGDSEKEDVAGSDMTTLGTPYYQSYQKIGEIQAYPLETTGITYLAPQAITYSNYSESMHVLLYYYALLPVTYHNSIVLLKVMSNGSTTELLKDGDLLKMAKSSTDKPYKFIGRHIMDDGSINLLVKWRRETRGIQRLYYHDFLRITPQGRFETLLSEIEDLPYPNDIGEYLKATSAAVYNYTFLGRTANGFEIILEISQGSDTIRKIFLINNDNDISEVYSALSNYVDRLQVSGNVFDDHERHIYFYDYDQNNGLETIYQYNRLENRVTTIATSWISSDFLIPYASANENHSNECDFYQSRLLNIVGIAYPFNALWFSPDLPSYVASFDPTEPTKLSLVVDVCILAKCCGEEDDTFEKEKPLKNFGIHGNNGTLWILGKNGPDGKIPIYKLVKGDYPDCREIGAPISGLPVGPCPYGSLQIQ